MPQIVEAPIGAIAINPYRRLHDYPYIPSKIEALRHSIKEVGLWPSVMARPLHNQLWQYELAFGHHRVEAARLEEMKQIPLIVDDLDDKQMLQYMGRENLEDYNAVFLIQLESWEAAAKSEFVSVRTEKRSHPIELAKLLGWTRPQGSGGLEILNNTAEACDAAYALIMGGYMQRDDFANLTVEAAMRIAERTLARHRQLDKVAAGSARPARETETAKQAYGRGAADTAAQVRAGTITRRDIRARVDFNAAARNRGQRPTPLFAVFANAVADNLRRTLQIDSDAEKLAEIEKVLAQLSMLEDWEALRRLDVELLNLAKRAEGWQKRLIPPQEKVRHFRALEKHAE